MFTFVFVAVTFAAITHALPLPQAFPAFGSLGGGNSDPFSSGLFTSQSQNQISPFGGGGGGASGNLFGSQPLNLFGGDQQLQTQQQQQTQQKADAAGVQDVSVGSGTANVNSQSHSNQKDGHADANSQSGFQGAGTDQNIKLVDQTSGAVQSQTNNKGQQILTIPGFLGGIQSTDQTQRQNTANGQVVNQGTVGDGRSQFNTLSNTNVDQNGSSQTSGTSSLAQGTGIHITSGSGSSAAGQMAHQANVNAKSSRPIRVR